MLIILFGSYATGRCVEDSYVENGTTYEYKSDYDMLVVTRHALSDKAWFSVGINDVISQDGVLTDASVIHHGLSFVNKRIKENNYFFKDIYEEGILLYDSGKGKLAKPGPLPLETWGRKAKEECEYWLEKGDDSRQVFEFCLSKQQYNKAAFELHQAPEGYYSAIQLVYVDYKPKHHNLEILNKKVGSIHPRFKEVFPQRNEEEKRLFQLPQKAYVDARYKKDYTITAEELE